MSSTERAPEPTMEDILASIRRIITDDEAGKGPAEKPAAAAQTEDEGLEGEADNQIIDDIARVLSSGGDAPANEDEEIMDLTAELGGLELVEEEEPEEVLETAAIEDTAPEFVEETEELLELEEVEPDVLEPDIEVVEAVEIVETVEFAEPVEAELPAEEAAVPEMPPLPEPEPVPEPVAQAEPEQPKLSASEEAATALERAIAALKAGQSPSATPPAPAPSFAAPSPAAMSAEVGAELPEAEAVEPPTGVIPLPGDIPMAVPMGSPEPEAETHPDPEADATLDLEAGEDAGVAEATPEGEDELVLTETTLVLEEAEPEAPFWPPLEAEAPEAEAAMAEPAPAPVFAPAMAPAAPEAAVVQPNGMTPHEATESKSLEDSIKEMLRPMLKEWLNENMPRMIREELDSDAVQPRQD